MVPRALVLILAFVAAPVLAQDAKPEKKAPAKKADTKPKAKKEEKKPARPRYRIPGMGGGGMPSDFSKQAVQFLTKELDLDEKQQKQAKKILDDEIAAVMAKIMDGFAKGQFEWGNPESMKKARKEFEKVRINVGTKLSKILTKAQKKEFEVLVEQFDRRAQRFEQSQRVREDPSQLFNPKPLSKQLMMSKAERSLLANKEETTVIMPYVEKVIDAQWALYEGRLIRRKDLLNAARGGASKKELAERVAQVRATEAFQRLELAAARQKLRELLTLKQEVRFVMMGLID